MDTKDTKDIELKELVGSHALTGVDTFIEKNDIGWGVDVDSQVVRFRLDGKTYVAVEDPDDGYRSSLNKIFISKEKPKNTFPKVRVVGRMRDEKCQTDNTLELIDVKTGKLVLAVGTDNINDYYPYFVGEFHPENMSINSKK